VYLSAALVRHFLAKQNGENFDANDTNEVFQQNCPAAAAQMDIFANLARGIRKPGAGYGAFGRAMTAAGKAWRATKPSSSSDLTMSSSGEEEG
jgi:hypothetical protein